MGQFDNFSGGVELPGAMYAHGETEIKWHSASKTYDIASSAGGGSTAWADITGTPTTLLGYGITDASSDSELAAHEADTTNIHGIADSAALVLTGDSRLSDARNPTAHAASHQNGGTDEILVTGLSGLLADAQTSLTHDIIAAHNGFPGGGTTFLRDDGTFAAPAGGPPSAHAASHQNGGSDEINVGGLSGLLADGQTPVSHATSHINGGTDELNVGGLNGVLADPQPPIIGAGGTQAVAGNDARLTDARTPTTHATSHINGGSDELNVAGLNGLLADGQTPLVHNILTAHNGFPGGTATFLRADGAFAAPTAAASVSQTEIDFGATPISEKLFTIADANVSPASKIIGSVSYEAPTGKDLDELDMDDLQLRFGPDSAQFSLYVRAADGSYLADKFKINYQVGA